MYAIQIELENNIVQKLLCLYTNVYIDMHPTKKRSQYKWKRCLYLF